MRRKILVVVIIVPALFFALAGAIASLGNGETSVGARVMSIVVPILLLAWIVKRYTSKEKKSTNKVIERVFETDEEGRLTSTLDYVAKTRGVCMVWTEAQKKFVALEKKDPTFLNTHEELKQVIGEMKLANKKLREIKPPKQYDSLQEDLSKSLVVFDEGLDTMVEGFITLDETKINKSSDLIDEGSDGLMRELGTILSLTKTEE
ncbi:DUF7018 domain-containing (lipo)protein [Bacillus mycoides]|uniref:DUF7018 domain-containing protein n=1 Tax=Bacillus mycoides TaxID=1405 RepID=A0AAP8GYG8_BACMY|nr:MULTISPECIES: hypothetical protein [Bacillus]EJR99351.1 hypothetical protein IKO_05312 [Bacillus cereus VDM034]EJS11425.1 hypothetical protein IKS_05533 [Bacillus cereus VDM062]AJH17148.1 hypothetical protein BG05_5556 [Bacillus mycoides]KUH40978.1 hypothetical protein M2E15_4761 [Bacillus mycoides]MBG9687777.1 hypothetical protein [Bacillus mycoides]